MARKKSRQQDPNDSSDSGDANPGAPASTSSCKHITKAVQLNSVKKKLKGGIRTSCDSCASKKSKIANIVPDVSLSNEEESVDENLTFWLCLTCAHVGCGRGQYKHALAHYNTPRSESHDLVVDIDQWIVWCYSCELKMAMNSTKKLQECVEYIRRHMQASSKSADTANTEETSSALNVDSLMSVIAPSQEKDLVVNGAYKKSSDLRNQTLSSSKTTFKPSKVRGLMNLGNTCFYNSVLQCLSVTPYLTKVLEKLTISGEEFSIPGDPKADNFEAPSVGGTLGDSGTLSGALLSQLLDMRNPDNHADVLRPQKLLKQVQDIYPQFRGHEQHDAHELLRHLLEGVRSDDIKRFQRVILQQHGLYGRKNDKVAADEKKKMKLYGQQLQDLILGVEGIFKGELISIVECQDCRHHSTRFESFLDLSLPVMEDKPLPPMRKKEQAENFTGDCTPRGHQSNKRWRPFSAQSKQKTLRCRRQEKQDGCVTILEEAGKNPEGPESEESDADVEDNVEQDAAAAENGKEVVESGYSSEKHHTGESDGTSPSIMAAEGEAEGENGGLHVTASPAAVSPAVSACLTASASPSAPASPTASVSTGPAESPSAPASGSSEGLVSTSPSVRSASRALTASAARHAPLPDVADEDGLDEELRITIPESGEGSIHISPVQPSEQLPERPVSRRGFAAADMTPELETRLLSLCLDERGAVNGHTAEGQNQDEGCCSGENQACAGVSRVEESLPAGEEVVQCNGEPTASCQEEPQGLGKVCGGVSKAKSAVSTTSKDAQLRAGSMNDNNKNDVAEWCKTLAPRHLTEEGECSVISCLNQFTSLELMTGNNKVGCDACTQRQNKGSEGKTVYTNSTKQLLISSPPPILIFHLKRFMMENYRFKKLQRFVSFPLDLDIAPFCSTKCKTSPPSGKTIPEVRYSLYGVVEHTGSLNTGHYIAYIKVRPNMAENDRRWSFLPSTRPFVYPKVESSAEASLTSCNELDGKWYSVSDSRVVEIAEAKVLKLQAYLLFYERVM